MPNLGRAHLSEHRVLSAVDSRLVRRDARNLAQGQPLSEHDVPFGTEKGVVETGRLKWPRAVGAAPGYALRGTDSAEGSTKCPTTFLHNLTHTTEKKPLAVFTATASDS